MQWLTTKFDMPWISSCFRIIFEIQKGTPNFRQRELVVVILLENSFDNRNIWITKYDKNITTISKIKLTCINFIASQVNKFIFEDLTKIWNAEILKSIMFVNMSLSIRSKCFYQEVGSTWKNPLDNFEGEFIADIEWLFTIRWWP